MGSYYAHLSLTAQLCHVQARHHSLRHLPMGHELRRDHWAGVKRVIPPTSSVWRCPRHIIVLCHQGHRYTHFMPLHQRCKALSEQQEHTHICYRAEQGKQERPGSGCCPSRRHNPLFVQWRRCKAAVTCCGHLHEETQLFALPFHHHHSTISEKCDVSVHGNLHDRVKRLKEMDSTGLVYFYGFVKLTLKNRETCMS